jgi:hypothetical protein
MRDPVPARLANPHIGGAPTRAGTRSSASLPALRCVGVRTGIHRACPVRVPLKMVVRQPGSHGGCLYNLMVCEGLMVWVPVGMGPCMTIRSIQLRMIMV